jgi:hypothetical protein
MSVVISLSPFGGQMQMQLRFSKLEKYSIGAVARAPHGLRGAGRTRERGEVAVVLRDQKKTSAKRAVDCF